MIASLVANAWPSAFTPNNIMGCFRKTGVHPINPGAIDDKMLSPSGAFQQQKPMSEQEASEAATDCTLFTAEQQQLYYEQCFQEGYDLKDPEYEAWLKIICPIDAGSETRSDTSFVSNSTSSGKRCSPSSHPVEASSSSSTSDILRQGCRQACKSGGAGMLLSADILPQNTVYSNIRYDEPQKLGGASAP